MIIFLLGFREIPYFNCFHFCFDVALTLYFLIDCISNVGRAWLYLGGLRLNLLLSCDDLDPAVKYHCKILQLTDKISSLKLEIQVS